MKKKLRFYHATIDSPIREGLFVAEKKEDAWKMAKKEFMLNHEEANALTIARVKIKSTGFFLTVVNDYLAERGLKKKKVEEIL